MRSAFFCDITQRRVAVIYRRFGTTYQSHLPETSVRHHHCTLSNVAEERRSQNNIIPVSSALFLYGFINHNSCTTVFLSPTCFGCNHSAFIREHVFQTTSSACCVKNKTQLHGRRTILNTRQFFTYFKRQNIMALCDRNVSRHVAQLVTAQTANSRHTGQTSNTNRTVRLQACPWPAISTRTSHASSRWALAYTRTVVRCVRGVRCAVTNTVSAGVLSL
jgi:hypothetical protein